MQPLTQAAVDELAQAVRVFNSDPTTLQCDRSVFQTLASEGGPTKRTLKTLDSAWKTYLSWRAKYSDQDWSDLADYICRASADVEGLLSKAATLSIEDAQDVDEISQIASECIRAFFGAHWKQKEWSFPTKLLCILCPNAFAPWDSCISQSISVFCKKEGIPAPSKGLMKPAHEADAWAEAYGDLIRFFANVRLALGPNIKRLLDADREMPPPYLETGEARILDKAFWILGKHPLAGDSKA